MNRPTIALVVGVVVVVAGVALVVGDELRDERTDPGDRPTAFPTTTAAGPGATGGTSPQPFRFTIDRVEACGRTCRDVTTTLANARDEPATGVTVRSRLFAGRNTTREADAVWAGRREVGTLEGGESRTITHRVELSLRDALAVQRRGGWVTVQTSVRSESATVTLVETEQVG